MFFTYIIYSTILDKYYIGFTSNIETRIYRHNQNSKGFTGRANDWILVYKESYKTKTEAYKRERTIKSWKSRTKIVELISKKTID